jgi:uncharacterized protein
MPLSLHEKCLNLYNDYCLVGGMPEVVAEWVNNQSLKTCMKLQQDLLATYRDDFHKYGGEIDARLLTKIMLSVSEQLGNKFVYTRVDPSQKTPQVKKAIEMLSRAKVCSKILHTTGKGLPLGAESNEKFFKAMMLDIGLVSAQLGLFSISRSEVKKIIFPNKGGLAEQFVGQQLRAAQTPKPMYTQHRNRCSVLSMALERYRSSQKAPFRRLSRSGGDKSNRLRDDIALKLR